jgi:soluble lytic murein transglycosylase
MRATLRWVTLASIALNVLLLQAITHDRSQLTDIRSEAATYRSTIADLEAERESLEVELAVINVLDSHRLRVQPGVRQQIAQTIVDAANRYDLPPELILAVIFTESAFDIDAESEVGALGLMQLMPTTASQLAGELEVEWRGRQLLTDPQVNILLGSFYLRKLIHRFDDIDKALAAYNVGPNRLRTMMARSGYVPKSYATKVRRVLAEYRERFF